MDGVLSEYLVRPLQPNPEVFASLDEAKARRDVALQEKTWPRAPLNTDWCDY